MARARSRSGVLARIGARRAVFAVCVCGLTSACVQRAGPVESGAASGAQVGMAPSGVEGEAPAGGVSVLAADGVQAFKPFGATQKIDVKTIDVEGQPFVTALEAVIKEAGQSAWEMQVTSPTATA